MMRLGSISSFHPAGWPYVIAAGSVSLGLLFFSDYFFFAGLVITAWCLYFFRDPKRVTPTRSGLVISPADGKVVAVQSVVPDESLGLGEEPRMRISIFLNVFDVHINRIPVEGRIVDRRYRPGKFFNASLDKASEDNERMSLTIQISGAHPFAGKNLGVVQIAGLVARRILCTAQTDQEVQAGERYGLIRFGSRADIYLPPDAQPLVCTGQYMIGGETVLADFTSPEKARQGEER